MTGIILCEGETDQIILSKYLEATYAFKYESSSRRSSFGKRLCSYSNGKHSIDILYVGGCDFNNDLSTILDMNILNADRVYEYIVLLTDHDSEDELEKRWQKINDLLAEKKRNITIEANRWISTEIIGQFNVPIIEKYLFLPIPIDKDGALETFLLGALERKDGNSFVVQQVRNFVDGLITAKKDVDNAVFNEEYLATRRLQVKAPLAVFLALVTPERIFEEQKKIFESIPWDEYESVRLAFRNFEVFRVCS